MTASLPLALGIALSPFAILPAVLVLLGPRGRAAGFTFAGAWWLGTTAPTFAAELATTALVASSTVLAPVVAATVGGRRATPVLESLRRWLDAHTATLLAAVTAVIGALVLYSGISGI
ncbi:GAP family protein [Demequina sediminis]|nr:GAP family protein [Demequina sediminis]